MGYHVQGAICGYCGKRLRKDEPFHPDCRRNNGVETPRTAEAAMKAVDEHLEFAQLLVESLKP